MSVLRGDCVEVMATLADNSIDAIVTDPPYGLEFMGKEWDSFKTGRSAAYKSGGSLTTTDFKNLGTLPTYTSRPAKRCAECGKQAWSGSPCRCDNPRWEIDNSPLHAFEAWTERWAREAYRILKPGGHLLAFGGSRTYHRLAAGIEDAGFEIRDQLMWVYASGFPKSHNLDGEWSGWGTALKPAHEPIVMARKPLIGTVAQNVQEHGTGALNIDGCRIGTTVETWPATRSYGTGTEYSFTNTTQEVQRAQQTGDAPPGRWPANVILTDPVFDGGWDGVVGGGETTSGALKPYVRATSARIYGGGIAEKGQTVNWTSPPDTGTYSRFFLVPKAPSRERTLTDGRRSPHPTQKPEALIRHLVTMVTPPGGIVLDPFLGSGTLGVACEALGVRWLGIEREDEYADWAEDRIADRKAKWEVTA